MALEDASVAQERDVILHATTVVHNGSGLLIQGRSGAGKSALALQLILLGAALVADDRTMVRRVGAGLQAAPPDAIAGQIEARGVGLLRLPHVAPVVLAAVVDLDTVETERLPQLHTKEILGIDLPLYRRVEGTHFPAALLLSLAHVREVPEPPPTK